MNGDLPPGTESHSDPGRSCDKHDIDYLVTDDSVVCAPPTKSLVDAKKIFNKVSKEVFAGEVCLIERTIWLSTSDKIIDCDYKILKTNKS